jgi:hypothetical protein
MDFSLSSRFDTSFTSFCSRPAMGGSNSTAQKQAASAAPRRSEPQLHKLHKKQEEILLLMMPVYYCADALTPDEHKIAADSWQQILNNTAPGFLALKKNNPDFKFTSSIFFFYDSFYTRLFDIHPLARALFKDTKSQRNSLVKMVSLGLSEAADVGRYEKTLVMLAEIHNEKGVKAIECKTYDIRHPATLLHHVATSIFHTD